MISVGYKVMKSIEMELSPSSINRAIRELRDFKEELIDACKELTEVLVNEGVEIAKMQLISMNGVYTGQLEHSIRGVFDKKTGIGIIRAGEEGWKKPYAIYVEYGTGIVGESSAHPEYKKAGWKYDKRDHGAEGWWYENERDGKWHWTQGYVSRPFMYNTLQWLEEAAPERAVEILL